MATPSSNDSGRSTRRRSSKSKKTATRGTVSLDSHHQRISSSYHNHRNMSSSKCLLSSDFRSRSIPINDYIQRTPSEVQLCEDEAIADYRDYCMYSRIVGGISRQQMKLQSDVELRYQNDETLGNIIRTRHESPAIEQSQQDRIMHILHEANHSHDNDDWGFYDHPAAAPDQEVFVLDM